MRGVMESKKKYFTNTNTTDACCAADGAGGEADPQQKPY